MANQEQMEKDIKSISDVMIRVDGRLQNLESVHAETLEQVKKTNGRVLELEKKTIEYDITMQFMKIGLGAIALPIFIALATWGIQSFIQIALK